MSAEDGLVRNEEVTGATPATLTISGRQADKFPPNIVKDLANRAGNCCSNPECRRPTSRPTAKKKGSINIGVGAHITAASPGGPRYDAKLTSAQRASIKNGIWLCQTCSSLIDRDVDKYTKKVLRAWKAEAELRAKSLIELPELPTGRNEPALSIPETNPKVSSLAFSARFTKFLGRKNEKEALGLFLGAKENFLWWLVTGPGGTGKSRLALELCREKRAEWYAGFLSKTETFKDWHRFRPTRPTLIVMDYVASRAEDVGQILLQLSRAAQHFPFPVRVLLLERDKGSWWSEAVRESSQSECAEISGHLFYNKPLPLKGLALKELIALAQGIFKTLGAPWTPAHEREFKRRMEECRVAEARHAFDNLILLCSVHHRVVDDQFDTYSVELLSEMKELHEREGDIELSMESARMAQKLFEQCQLTINAANNAQVMVASPGGIQAHQVVIKTSKKRAPNILPIQGAIGHNLAKRNYTLHLIERYNDFQKWDSFKQGKGKYIVIHRAIKTEFGSKWDLVSESQFFKLVDYLQRRILNSKLGRIKNSRGEKCFSTWEEWLQKNHGGESNEAS